MSLDWLLLGLRLTATLILYTFLGVAFYIIWRELKQAASKTEAVPPITDQLRVVAVAEDQPFVVGQALPLQPLTLVGRDADNHLTVSYGALPSWRVRLRREQGSWWLEWADEPNGARPNQSSPVEATRLTDGDLIELDDVSFRLETGSG